jgi:excinuclease ABC subunit A
VNIQEEEYIEIFGAREHNLKNIDLQIPRNRLVVFTGISGSGKSSLAFDTIYAEGQRRYMESFSAYARSFIGNPVRPDVDKINGLSPVISIEQKTTSRNPRSTVGTLTEIYDFLRLLYARAGEAYSYLSGKKMIKQSEDQIIQLILSEYTGEKISLLAPLVRARKGHYRELFVKLRKMGFLRVRVDGKIDEITPKMQLDRYKVHDIDLVIDRILVSEAETKRLGQSVREAFKHGEGTMLVHVRDEENPRYFSRSLMCPDTGLAYDEPAPNLFSFNSPYGMCKTCNGLGYREEISPDLVIPDPELSVRAGGIAPLGEFREIAVFEEIEAVLKKHKLNISTPISKIPKEVLNDILFGYEVTARIGSITYKEEGFRGVIPYLKKFLEETESNKIADWISEYVTRETCPDCKGQRLNIIARHYRIADKNISELAQTDLKELEAFFSDIENALSEKQKAIAVEILKEIRKRLGFLTEVGLGYLTLDRQVNTLSGGEMQRIRLATQIGTQLTGVLYILDEPSIGLHARDNAKLITALKNLRDIGNSVLVVEHDKDMMLEADYLVDIGPGAGKNGGMIVGEGKPADILKQDSLTAQYLNNQIRIKTPEKRREGNGKFLELKGLTGNNLKNIDVRFPLGKFICVTGVSGCGKSSIVHDTLYPILNAHFFRAKRKPLPYESISGLEAIDKVIEVDQSPIGRTPRSNPATYTGVFTDIRDIFTQLPESKIRGYKPGRFSFNVKGGRCEECEGAGLKTIEMEFLPDVLVECPSCRGKRYNRQTLEVRFKGKSISDVLDMSVDEAVLFFENQPKILRKISTLQEVGLGYISLGQHATTLSGGEAQRVKLATELSKRDTGKTLYILDEPTTGLHFKDIHFLLDVLNKLADKGNTVIVIEHNMDVIKTADHIIDVGPEGGSAGGRIIAEGTPEEVAENPLSLTGKFLKKEL